jgi:WD40 repeat protein
MAAPMGGRRRRRKRVSNNEICQTPDDGSGFFVFETRTVAVADTGFCFFSCFSYQVPILWKRIFNTFEPDLNYVIPGDSKPEGTMHRKWQTRLHIVPKAMLAILVIGLPALSIHRLSADPEASKSKEKGSNADPVESLQSEDRRGKVDIYGDPLPEGVLARMGSARLRGEVLSFSDDGKTLVTIGADHTFHYWNVANGKEQKRRQLSFVISQSEFDSAHRVKACSPNGKLFVSDDEETIRVWEIASGKEVRKIPNPTFPFNRKTISRLAVTNDGRLVAIALLDFSALKCRLHLVNATTREEHILTFERGDFSYPGFSPDGKTLALGNASGIIRLYDTKTAKELRQIKAQAVKNTALPAFSPDGQNLAWIDGSGMAKVWNVGDGSEKSSFPAPGVGNWMQFSPDGKRLAVVGENGIPVWDLANNKELRRLPIEHTGWISRNFYPIAFSPDGRTLAVTNRTGMLSDLAGAKLYDIATGKLLLQPKGHIGEFLSIVFSVDGKLIASSTKGETRIRLWDTATGKPLPSLEGESEACGLAFSPDGKFLFSGHCLKIHCWDVKKAAIVGTFQVKEKSAKNVFGVSLLATDGRKLIALGLFDYSDRKKSQNLLIRWDIATGNLDKRVEFPGSFLFLFAKDGTTFRLDDLSIVRDVVTGKQVVRLTEKGYGFAVSEDGKKLAVGFARALNRPPQPVTTMMAGVNLYGIPTGGNLCQIETGPARFSFSPDGRFMLAVGQNDLSLWEIATARRVYRLPAPAPFSGAKGLPFSSFVSFSPNGKTVATGLKDSTIVLWDVTPSIRPAKKIGDPVLEKLWSDLGGEDAATAYKAIWTLADSPGSAIPFLKMHLKPAVVNTANIQKLVTDLGSDQFKVRNAAFLELNKLDIEIEPVLRGALAQATEEFRRRVDLLLARPSAIVRGQEVLRGYRAIQILEYAGTPDARQLLQALAKGAGAARITQEAKASLERLK